MVKYYGAFKLVGKYRCFDVLDQVIAELTAVRPNRVAQIALPPDWKKHGLCQVVQNLKGHKVKKDHVFVKHRFLNVVKAVNVAKFGARPLLIDHNFSEARVCIRPVDHFKTTPILLAPLFEAESEKAYGCPTTLAIEDGSSSPNDSQSPRTPKIKSPLAPSPSPPAHPSSNDQQGGDAISGSSGDSEGKPGKGCGNKGKATKKRVHDDADDVPDVGELG